jgi:serine/threonine protein kinase
MSACEKTHGPHASDPEATLCESVEELHARDDVADKRAQAQAGAQPGSREVASYHEFASALLEIGLIDAAELERFAVDSAQGVLGLSSALVKAGKLTPYQAAAVYQKKSRGLLIGNYLILDKVGQGGMGMVFKARHRKLGRLGALKILPPSFTRDKGAVTRFRREFETAARLKHVNVVAAFEADEDRGVHFLVMDYVVGINLERVVVEHGPLPVPVAVECLIQSARGLEAAHENGIIHRDIKPGNLMLDRRGTVRVLDLGLARIVDASNPFSKTVAGRLTQSGTYMGSVDYMAPEQAEDAHTADHRSDIYSLGCTFFFLLTGREPFAGASILKRMVAHQEHAAPSLRAIRPEVSPALEAVYQKMMAKRPEERPASMTEVIAQLQAAKHSSDNIGNVAVAPESRRAPEVCTETPLKRAGPPQSTIDSVIFTRRVEGEGTFTGQELNLRDLVMDVRSDVCETGAPAAGHDEPECASDEHEWNLRELAMELRAEAAPPAAPKPPGAARPPKPAALPRHEETPPAAPKPPTAAVLPRKRPEEAPPAAPKPPSAEIQQPKRLASPRPEEMPPAAPKPPAAAVLPRKRHEDAPPAAPKPPSAEIQQPKRLASPRPEEMPPAAPKPPAAAVLPRKRQEDAPPVAPKPPAAEIQPLKRSKSPRPEIVPSAAPCPPGAALPLEQPALTAPGDVAPNKGLAILAVVTAVLLVVAVVLFMSRRPAAVGNNESSTPVQNSNEREHSSDVAPAPPL